MKRSTDRILTTHVGSLPRPADLLALIESVESGAGNAAAFEARVSTAVAEIARQQMEAGVDIINDGEMDKPSYATYVKDRLSGFEEAPDTEVMLEQAEFLDFPGFRERHRIKRSTQTLRRPACTGPVAHHDPKPLAREISNLKAAVAASKPVEAFLGAASPGVVPMFLKNHYYKTHEEYLAAIGAAMRVEYQTIYQAGFILQVDCPDLTMSRHTRFADKSLAEFRKIIELHVEVLNHALEGIPADRVRVHLCWGNYEGPHHLDVPLRDIIDIVFKVRADAILYEAANPRHAHEWAIFKDVKLPAGKILIPGVLDSTTNFIEHPELVAQRICNLANLVGRENVMAGTDCGFATAAVWTAVDPQITFAKLHSMAEGARIASKLLW